MSSSCLIYQHFRPWFMNIEKFLLRNICENVNARVCVCVFASKEVTELNQEQTLRHLQSSQQWVSPASSGGSTHRYWGRNMAARKAQINAICLPQVPLARNENRKEDVLWLLQHSELDPHLLWCQTFWSLALKQLIPLMLRGLFL